VGADAPGARVEVYRVRRRRLLIPAAMALFAAGVIVAAIVSTVREGAPGAAIAFIGGWLIVLPSLVGWVLIRMPWTIELASDSITFVTWRGRRRRTVPLRDLQAQSMMPVNDPSPSRRKDEMVTWTFQGGSVVTFRSLYDDFDVLRRHVRERAPQMLVDH
jgi:hypothetical protein